MRLKQFFSVLLTFLVVSIGVMWGEDQVYKTALFGSSYNSKGVNAYTGVSFSSTNNGFTVDVANANNYNNGWGYIKIGGKNGAYTGSITTNATIDKAITKVNLTIDAITANNVTSITLKTSSNGSSWSDAGTFAKEVGTKTVTLSSPTTNLFYKIEAVCTQGSSNGLVTISKVEYYAETSGSQETTVCAAPTFSPAAGAVVSGTNVTITSSTEGATIYYTTDGTNPSTSSATAQPITINAAKTIKAIAVKEGLDNSSIATAAYTVVTPLATMDEIFAAATSAGTTETDVYITFNNWVVSGAKGKTAYVTDGTKGFIIYYSDHGFTEGDILSGTGSFKIKLYNGAAELTAKNSGTINIAKGGTATLNILDADGIASLSGVNTGSLIQVSGACTQESTKYYIAGVQLYTTLFSYTAPTAGNNYNCTGVYVQYNSTKEMMPRKAADIEEIVEAGAPDAPTFSVAEGTYTSVQSVELSCATDGATIYYTTDGATPDNTSTEYTTAISVGESMTIKAIAIKDDKSSTVVTAEYTINLPENEEVRKTWDLSIDETASASTTELTWTATYVSMSFAKGSSSTNANNYYPGTEGKSYTSTRAYANGIITITPSGKSLTTIVFTATSDNYATALANSTWTNATATASGTIVTVTPTDGEAAVSAVIGATCGFTAVQVNYITDTRAAAGLSWSTSAVEITLGELFSAPTLNNPNSIAAGDISIKSNNTSLATVAAGVVSLVENATGTATITAIFDGNATYKPATISYTIKVNKPLSPWASVYTSNVTLSAEGGTSASAAKVIFDEVEGGYDAIKAGTGNVSGAVKITIPAQATTLHYHAYGWNEETVTLNITAPTGVTVSPETQAIASNSGIKSNSPFTLENDPDPKNDAYYAVELSGNDEEIELTFTATSGKRFVIFGVNQEGGILPELQSIEISGDLSVKSGYKAGDALDLSDFTVMATYTLAGTPQTPVDITEDAELELTYDALIEGQESVTITATYKGKTDDIEIALDEAVISADPKIYVSKQNVNFGTVAPNASVDAQSITVTLTNVAAATATLGGTNPEAFSISKTAIVDGDAIEISVASTAVLGSYSATITISDDAAAADSKVVNLSLTVENVETPISTTSQWVAATDADLVDGAVILITGVKDSTTYAMGQQNNNNRAAIEASLSEGILTPGDNTMSFTLVEQGDGTFALRTSNGKYLYAASSSSNYLKTQAKVDNNAKWTLTTTSAVAASSSNRNKMQFNSSSLLFSCYVAENNMQAIQLYKLAAPAIVTYTITYNLGGAEGSIEPQVVEEGQTVVLAAKPAREGYYFMGWEDESGNSYEAGEEIAVVANMTLTAQWEKLGEYSRDVTVGNFGTICLANPVYEGYIENAEVYKVISFSNVGKDGLILEMVDAMEAGVPYFFLSKSSTVKFYYSTAHSASEQSVNGLHGTIGGTTVGGANNYVLQNNQLRETTGDAITIAANRAYLVYNEVPLFGSADPVGPADAQRRRVISMQQSQNAATGCEDIEANELQARKLLIDGHLYIIREAKTYNAQGQLVE